MRILRNILITLLLLALLGISIVGIMVEFPSIYHYHPTRINELGRSFLRVMRPGNLLLGVWVGLALSCVLVFLMTVLRPRKQMKIEVQMGGGRVVILDSAIKRYIRSAIAEIPGITVRRIDLRDTRLGVSTDLYADVRAHGNLPVLERQMIQRVRGALAEDLGITSIGDVHVFIRDFEVAERVPVHTAVRRPQAREPRPEETEPEPARARASAPEGPDFTHPTGSTGPFDQVPMPQSSTEPGIAVASAKPDSKNTGAVSAGFSPYGTTPPTESAEQSAEKYFTPSPSGAITAHVTDLGPKDVYALAEATDENVISDETGSATPDPTAGNKPRRRGLFGLFGASELPAEASDTTAQAEYHPESATESVPATPEVIMGTDQAISATTPEEAPASGHQPESSSTT